MEGFTVTNARRLPWSRERVFGAFADPAQLVHWWGPHGFTNRIDVFDFRAGGDFHITMTSEKGKAFENLKRFTDIVVPSRIVFLHLQPMHDFTMIMLFAESGEGDYGGCDLTWRMDFAPGSDDGLHDFLHAANEQNFDRLETYLRSHP